MHLGRLAISPSAMDTGVGRPVPGSCESTYRCGGSFGIASEKQPRRFTKFPIKSALRASYGQLGSRHLTTRCLETIGTITNRRLIGK